MRSSIGDWIKYVLFLGTLLFATLPNSGCSAGVQYPLFHPRASVGTEPWTIKAENQKPGTTAWLLWNPATHHEIEGYASLTSVDRGGSISIYVNTSDPSYTMDIYRLGWYGGTGAREVAAPIVRSGVVQPIPSPDPVTGLIECNWTDPYVLHIPNSADPTNWASGVYLVKLTGNASGKQSYVTFVVRDDARPSDLLFQASVTTYEAYNTWGGRSLYSNPRAYKVSFNRPYRRYYGAGDLLEWEYNMIRFLEREGYDVTYSTDIDTQTSGKLLLQHNAFLSVGHDEYWSWKMRNHVEAARDQGVSLGFFGANTSYWQIRFAKSTITGDPNRTIICYKDASLDPMAADPTSRAQTTIAFRSSPVNRPENEMVGEMYQSWESGSKVLDDIVVTGADNWVFKNTGLKNGDHLVGLLGYEADRIFSHGPAGTARIAHSPYLNAAGQKCYSDMTVYQTLANSTVVAVGSMNWNWGVDGFALDHPVLTNPAAQQAMRNILQRFGAADPASIAIPSQQASAAGRP